MLNDSLERSTATDPRHSYIVQAPAGSGKTEILTQRFLRLLGGVTNPEQIIALTFTRKAANEMRERILLALINASSNVKANSPHQQQTLNYAEAALKRDKELGWELLKQPGRLRVITIDSLCQTLTNAIPLSEKQIPYAKISDKPQLHYINAARLCFNYAKENKAFKPSLKTLLLHVDNRQDKLIELFAELLSNRDQWLLQMYLAKEQDKATYEIALASILQHELNRFKLSISEFLSDELQILSQRLSIIEGKIDSPRYKLRDWNSFNELDSEKASSLASLLLTSQNTLRKAFDHHVGLKRGVCPDEVYDELKNKSKSLLAKLELLPDFLEALIRVKSLPKPSYDQSQWEALQALLQILPLIAAHLHLVFNEQNEVDFTAISLQALNALGDEENPTDLTLYLDNTINHILVDEFQDTSIQQFQLLTKLVQNFQPNDGKTLFVVGDPMQSIYRFRAAEVGLFLRAKEHGIGAVHLKSLELSSNFRSTSTIVDWVNNNFSSIFPPRDDIESGAISFHKSINVIPSCPNSNIFAFHYENREEEANAIVEKLKQELDNHPDDKIAILVRSRKQLSSIIRNLREQKIPFQGIEIDLLAKLPHIKDLWSLTQALLMPANRLAWLSFLRSPWCGLSLSDLHAIANYEKSKSIYFALSQLDKISNLSEHGRIRADFIYQVLDDTLNKRNQESLIDWISNTLKKLHINEILEPSLQEDLEQFWLLLDHFEENGQIKDLNQFHSEFNKLYSQLVVPSNLQIMTIHKSKGLEFDCVIIPSLSTKPQKLNTPLMRWLKIPSQQQEEIVLLSPIKASEKDNCLLYDYLGKLDKEKSNYELQRLLYVAVTRAKKRLYLFDNGKRINDGSFRHLLKKQEFIEEIKDPNLAESNLEFPDCYHLPIEYYQQTRAPIATGEIISPQNIANHRPRLLGIVAHELLQWICENHPSSIDEIPWEIANYQLRSLGFDNQEFSHAITLIKRQIIGFFNCPIGQWIMKAHKNEQNEYEILVYTNGFITTKIIDRTFCDEDLRWIIDFKTGIEDKNSTEKYRKQVNAYAEIFANANSSEAIRCGLYYLESNHWVRWEYENDENRRLHSKSIGEYN